MNDENNTLIKPKTNLEIFIEHVDLLQRCVDFQFAKLWKSDPGKLQFRHDMFQDMCVWMLTYDNAKLNNAYQNHHINALITRVLINNLWSKSSHFYKDYIDFDRHQLWEINEYVSRKEDAEEDTEEGY